VSADAAQGGERCGVIGEQGEHILGITPVGEDEKPRPRRTQADKWATNFAARQFYEREGHLRMPGKHVETIVIGGDDGDQEKRPIKLGPGSATSAAGPPR
jgi:hypothetical protein